MANDIKQFGSGEGIGFYWAAYQDGVGSAIVSRYLQLVAIDEVGAVTRTPLRSEFDPAAPDEGAAVQEHLAGAISAADAALARRREKLPKEPEQPKKPPIDPATQAFIYDDDGELAVG